MPEALRAAVDEDEEGSASSWERSRPRETGAGVAAEDFLVAVLALAPLGVARWVDSSAARRASFSAFLRSWSWRLASASSLLEGRRKVG